MSTLLCVAKSPSPLAWVVIGIDALIVVVLLLHTLVVALNTRKRSNENTAEARARVARRIAKAKAKIARKEAKKLAKVEKKAAKKLAKAEKKAAKKLAKTEKKAAKKAAKAEKARIKQENARYEQQRAEEKKTAKAEKKLAKKIAKLEKKNAKKTAKAEKKLAKKTAKLEKKNAKKTAKAEKKLTKKTAKLEKKNAKKLARLEKKKAKKTKKAEKKLAKKTAKAEKKAAKKEKKVQKKLAKKATKLEKKNAKKLAKEEKKAAKKAAKAEKARIKQENARYEQQRAEEEKAKAQKVKIAKIKAEMKKAAEEELQVRLKAAEAKAKEEKAKEQLEKAKAEEKQAEIRKQTIEMVMSAVNESVTDLSKKVEEGDRKNSEEIGSAVEKLTALVASMNADKPAIDVEKAIEASQNNVMLQIKEVLGQALAEIDAKIAKIEANATVAPVVTETVATEVVAEPVVEEAVVVAEEIPTVEEVVVQPVVETVVTEETTEETEGAEDSEANKRVTFAEKMLTLDDDTKAFYTELDNEFRSYRKVNARVSIRGVSYRLGRDLIAKITARGKTMRLHLALDVNAFPQNVYFQKDLSDSKAYEEVPFMVKVRSSRGLKNALKLIEELAAVKGIEKKARYTAIDSIAELRENYLGQIDDATVETIQDEAVATEVVAQPVVQEAVVVAEEIPAVEETAEEVVVTEVTVPVAEEIAEDTEDDRDINKRVSFAEKMITLDEATKSFYQELDNEFRSYRKVNARVSIRGVSYRLGRDLIAKITARGKTMRLHLALDVNAFPQNVYFQKDLSDSKAYEEVPFMVKVKSVRGLKNALKLIEELATAKAIEKKTRFTAIDSIAALSEIVNDD